MSLSPHRLPPWCVMSLSPWPPRPPPCCRHSPTARHPPPRKLSQEPGRRAHLALRGVVLPPCERPAWSKGPWTYYYFNSLAQVMRTWEGKVVWPCPFFVAFCDLWMEHSVPTPTPPFPAGIPVGDASTWHGFPPRPPRASLVLLLISSQLSQGTIISRPKATPHPLCASS